MINLDDIEQRIVDSLNEFSTQAHQNSWRSNKIWTNKIKEIIGRIG